MTEVTVQSNPPAVVEIAVRGLPGPAGPAGGAGADGPPGPQGGPGPIGAQGPTGSQGPAGSEGAQGAAGPQGIAGADGAQGPMGAAGAQGPAGSTGPQGAQGAQGSSGAQGVAGAQGPQGSVGAQGTTGPAGPQGDTGSIGAQGAQGAAGPTGAQGLAGPQGAVGAQGPAGADATVPGSDTEVPFNDGGSALGTDPTFTFDKTTKQLSITNGFIQSGTFGDPDADGRLRFGAVTAVGSYDIPTTTFAWQLFHDGLLSFESWFNETTGLHSARIDGNVVWHEGNLTDRSVVSTLTNSSGTVNIDCALGDYFTHTLAANVTSITFSNLPAAGHACTLSIQFTQDAATPRTVALPASFKALGGSDTAISATLSKVTVLVITTFDQGTTWRYSMQESA